jgi:3-oxoacyl-[acyl-carrier-protein] synthase-1
VRRVVVTGIGVVSSIGNNAVAVLRSLREGCSGIDVIPEMRDLGLKCWVGGRVRGLEEGRIEKKARQTMSAVAQYATIAALEALEDAALSHDALRNGRVGVVVGTSFGGIGEWAKAYQVLQRYKNPSRLGGIGLVKGMHSTVAGNLAAYLGVQGRAYSLCSSFCAGTDNIGHTYELVARGIIDVGLCGGAEERTWRQVGAFFDNVGGLPSSWNKQPYRACRPYDRDREGMVLAEGAGILLVEALEHAERRGIRPYAEIVGYGAANDGNDMFRPSGTGLKACLQQALAMARDNGVAQVDYINTHGTGTRLHDPLEVRVIKEVFGRNTPFVSSTKPLAGHSLGATGAHEAVFTLLMLHHGFIAPTMNLEHTDTECQGVAHVRTPVEMPLTAAMTFNAGLGGTNSCLVFRKL